MKTVDITARVWIQNQDGTQTILKIKAFKGLSVMKTSIAKQWTRRAFNDALKNADKDQIIAARYSGQLKVKPYTYYGAGLSGVNGECMDSSGDW